MICVKKEYIWERAMLQYLQEEHEKNPFIETSPAVIHYALDTWLHVSILRRRYRS